MWITDVDTVDTEDKDTDNASYWKYFLFLDQLMEEKKDFQPYVTYINTSPVR